MIDAIRWMSRSDDDWEFDDDELPQLFVWAQAEPADLVETLAEYLGGHELRYEEVFASGGSTEAASIVLDGNAHALALTHDWRDPFTTVMTLAAALRDSHLVYIDRDDLGTDALDVVFLPREQAIAMETQSPQQVAQRLQRLQLSENILHWVMPEDAAVQAQEDSELAEAQLALRDAVHARWGDGLPGKVRTIGTLYRAFRDRALTVDADWKHDPTTLRQLAAAFASEGYIRERLTPTLLPTHGLEPNAEDAPIPSVVRKPVWWKFWQ